MTEPIVFSAEEVNFIADTKFFLAKARISAKIRRILEQVHEALRSELKGKALLVPGRFTLDAFQFVKGEHLENFSWITGDTESLGEESSLARSLSKIRLIDCGCAGFGQIFRSFSLHSHHYSPHTIEQSDSTQHNLVTFANLGQAPRTR